MQDVTLFFSSSKHDSLIKCRNTVAVSFQLPPAAVSKIYVEILSH